MDDRNLEFRDEDAFSEYTYTSPDKPYTFLTKTPETYVNVEDVGPGAESTVMERYNDDREATAIHPQINAFLRWRGCWEFERDPLGAETIDFVFMGTDVSIDPKYATFKTENWETLTTAQQNALVELFMEKRKVLSEPRGTPEGAELNRVLFAKARIANRLTRLTRVVGNKVYLYNLMRSYAGRDANRVSRARTIVPGSFQVDTSVPGYFATVQKELSAAGPDQVWVVRPTVGSKGVAMRFATKETILDQFEAWAGGTYAFKNETVRFKDWIFSAFKRSFLWKLDQSHPESKRMLKFKKGENPFVGLQTELWNKDPILAVDGREDPEFSTAVDPVDLKGEKVYFREQRNPGKSKRFREYTLRDTAGRINKARLWLAVNIEHNAEGVPEYSMWIWKKVQFELCAREFDGTFGDPARMWTDAGEYVYGNLNDPNDPGYVNPSFRLDTTNAGRAYDLDFMYVVDWDSGRWGRSSRDWARGNAFEFPKGTPFWNTVKGNLLTLLEIFMTATRDNVHCISEAREDLSQGCFQYFGMDFIVDDSANVWLLEFNTRPWCGMSNWWAQRFDPGNVHVNHKMHLVEGLLRSFVDPKTDTRVIRRRPYGDAFVNHWWGVPGLKFTYAPVEYPVAVYKQSFPARERANWVVNRERRKNMRDMGWSLYPYSKFLETAPDMIVQGMTPLMRWMTENGKTNDLAEVYPDLRRAKTVNRIFPFVHVLGNKAVLVERLQLAFPQEWSSILPYSFTVSTDDPDWERVVYTNIEQFGLKSVKWIVKPATGMQGKGIKVSKNVEDLVRHVREGEDVHWVWSWYIDRPLLVKQRKNHVRVFVLVSKTKKGVEVYLMKIPFIFLAALPYAKNGSPDPKPDPILEQTGATLDLKGLKNMSAYRNLTNLALGQELFSTRARGMEPKFEKDRYYAYDLLSGNARKEIDKHRGKSFYDTHLAPQVERMVGMTLQAVEENITCVSEECYHYLAFDIMFDDGTYHKDGIPRAWLLEVNVNPGLRAPTKNRDVGLKNFLQSMFTRLRAPQNVVDLAWEDPRTGDLRTGRYAVNKKFRGKSREELSKMRRKLSKVPEENLFEPVEFSRGTSKKKMADMQGTYNGQQRSGRSRRQSGSRTGLRVPEGYIVPSASGIARGYTDPPPGTARRPGERYIRSMRGGVYRQRPDEEVPVEYGVRDPPDGLWYWWTMDPQTGESLKHFATTRENEIPSGVFKCPSGYCIQSTPVAERMEQYLTPSGMRVVRGDDDAFHEDTYTRGYQGYPYGGYYDDRIEEARYDVFSGYPYGGWYDRGYDDYDDYDYNLSYNDDDWKYYISPEYFDEIKELTDRRGSRGEKKDTDMFKKHNYTYGQLRDILMRKKVRPSQLRQLESKEAMGAAVCYFVGYGILDNKKFNCKGNYKKYYDMGKRVRKKEENGEYDKDDVYYY